MSRASEAARKAYPPTNSTRKRHAKRVQSERVDTHQPARTIFQKGYEQAEKDTIERAESHLESALLNFLDADTVKWIIKDFKKAMEEE